MNFASSRGGYPIVFGICIIVLLVMGACSGDKAISPTGVPTPMPAYSGLGKAVILIHDAPVDSLQEVWLTVSSVRLIGANGGSKGETLLYEPMRLDFLKLDSVSRLLTVADLEAQTFSKIRLEVSDPEFVDKNGEVIESSDIKLVANGKVDLNFQHPVSIEADELTVVSIDLDLDNSIQVNQTGKGKFILRPQFKVDAVLDSSVTDSSITVEMVDATIIRTNPSAGTIDVELPGSPAILVVVVNPGTNYLNGSGDVITFADLKPATRVFIFGYFDAASGNFVATEIRLA